MILVERSIEQAGQAEVTFVVAHGSGLDDRDAQLVSVVGDFNDWDPWRTPLRHGPDGYTATVRLPADARYRFRYLAEDGNWFNDPEADEYLANDFGGADGVLDLAARPTTDPPRAGQP